MSVNMQFSGNTDCHTSDVGHWFAMTKTDFVDSLSRPRAGRLDLMILLSLNAAVVGGQILLQRGDLVLRQADVILLTFELLLYYK